MISKDDFWCIETVGKGIYKLTVYGKDPVSKASDRGAAEILLDDDDIEEMVLAAHKAQRAKVTISAS
jgi:hypothetical protein